MYEVIGYGQTVEEATADALERLEAPADAEVNTVVVAEPRKKILGLFGGSPARVRASYDEAVYIEKKKKEEEEQKKKQAKEWLDKISASITLIVKCEYQKAENTIYELLSFYDDNCREIERLGYLRSKAYLEKDEAKMYEYHERSREIETKIAPIKKHIDDLRFAYALTIFKRRNNISVESIVKILGEIYHNEIKDETLKSFAKEITDKYGEKYLSKAKECYRTAIDFMDDGEMTKAKKYMALPGMLNYKDAEQLYAILRVVVDNDPDSYEDIMKILVNGKDEIESANLRQVAEDTIKEIGRVLKAKREQYPGKSLPKNKYTTVLAAKATNALADDEVLFMNWVIAKNKDAKEYDDKIRNGEDSVNPIGDSDFPADVEAFPASEEIW